MEYKGFSIELAPGALGYVVKNIGQSGQVKSLQGYFTNYSFAKRAIDQYIVSKKQVSPLLKEIREQTKNYKKG